MLSIFFDSDETQESVVDGDIDYDLDFPTHKFKAIICENNSNMSSIF